MQRTDLIEDYAFLLYDLLSPEECRAQITASEAIGYQDAPVTTLSGPQMLPQIRNNTRVMLDNSELASMIYTRLQGFAPTKPLWQPIGLNERLRYYRYDPGEAFALHRDGAFIRSPSERSFYTVLIYLNEDFKGGETIVENTSVRPQTGMALVFLHPLLHEGSPLLQGRKYVLRSDLMYRRVGMS